MPEGACGKGSAFMSEVDQLNGRTLAYVGDAVWSLVVREYLVKSGIVNGKVLMDATVSYVSAVAQAQLYDVLHGEGWFSEAEEAVFHRARNAHSGSVPRSTTVQTYRKATGFEAIVGMLELNGNGDRIEQILDRAVKLHMEMR